MVQNPLEDCQLLCGWAEAPLPLVVKNHTKEESNCNQESWIAECSILWQSNFNAFSQIFLLIHKIVSFCNFIHTFLFYVYNIVAYSFIAAAPNSNFETSLPSQMTFSLLQRNPFFHLFQRSCFLPPVPMILFSSTCPRRSHFFPKPSHLK